MRPALLCVVAACAPSAAYALAFPLRAPLMRSPLSSPLRSPLQTALAPEPLRALLPRARSSTIRCASSTLEPLFNELLSSDTDTDREATMEAAVKRWWAEGPGTSQSNSDELVEIMTRHGVSVQTAALAAHERGEDTSEASKTLQTLVNMTFHVKILVRDLKKAEEGLPD